MNETDMVSYSEGQTMDLIRREIVWSSFGSQRQCTLCSLTWLNKAGKIAWNRVWTLFSYETSDSRSNHLEAA